ncbi:hypothetical protein DESC_740133 [Desulfosarcina cetonica]|nr:hypothetical protein DESC_740133 [Desulfosarcina cetonica]
MPGVKRGLFDDRLHGLVSWPGSVIVRWEDPGNRLENVWNLEIIAFVDHKRLHGLDTIQAGDLFGVEFEQAEAFLEQHHENQVETTGDHADRHHPPDPAKRFAFFHQIHGAQFDPHHDDPMEGNRLRIHQTDDIQDAFFLELAHPGTDRVLGNPEVFSNYFIGLSALLQMADDGNVQFVDLHPAPFINMTDDYKI